MLKVGALVSGGGTNLQAIINKIEDGTIDNAKLVTVVSNRQNAYALERAKKYNINSMCIAPKDYNTKEDFNNALIEYFNEKEVDLIVLAGYLVVLGESFVKAFRNRIMNIHPSLIPAFCGDGYYGIKVHEAALHRGVKLTGATVHFVDEGTDTGPIILQKSVKVKNNDTPEILQKRVMEEAEWEIFPEAIRLFSLNKIKVENGKAIILD